MKLKNEIGFDLGLSNGIGKEWDESKSRIPFLPESHGPRPMRILLASAVLAFALHTAQSASLSDWPNRQELAVPAPGLVKLNLPVETLDAAQAGLEDLRILDPGSAEVSYAIE